MREVAKIFDFWRRERKVKSLPQSACSADSPLVRGGLYSDKTNRPVDVPQGGNFACSQRPPCVKGAGICEIRANDWGIVRKVHNRALGPWFFCSKQSLRQPVRLTPPFAQGRLVALSQRQNTALWMFHRAVIICINYSSQLCQTFCTSSSSSMMSMSFSISFTCSSFSSF